MTRQENILTLNEHLEHWKRLLSEKICDQDEGEKTIDALQNAIKALEQEPCGDCISRDKAIVQLNHVLSDWDYDWNVAIRKCIETIKKLPSVTVHPKMGKWVYTGDYITDGMLKCSECGFEHDVSERFSFCPNCGAKMQEVEDES